MTRCILDFAENQGLLCGSAAPYAIGSVTHCEASRFVRDEMNKNKEEKIRHAVEELIGKGNLGIVDETFATDYVAHAGEKEYSGHSFVKRFTNQLRTAIPDIRVVEVKFLSQDAETIVWQRTLTGTHEVEMQGIPPSGKKVKWVEMVVTRFKNGKIAEDWVVSELMGELLLRVPRIIK